MHYIVYVSEAKTPMSESELAELLAISRRNNEAAGVTGLLIYKYSPDQKHGSFLQLLEGEKQAVEDTYRRIVRDRRHVNKIVLDEGQTAERQFADWSMGFKNITPEKVRSLPGFADIGDEPFDSEAYRQRCRSAIDLIRFFYESD